MKGVATLKKNTIVGATRLDRAARIHIWLKNRNEAEREIARELREELKEVGAQKWLRWCEKEFGWRRSAAYDHLNPERMRSKRERAREERQRQSPHGVDINSRFTKRDLDPSERFPQPKKPQRADLTFPQIMQVANLAIECLSSFLHKSKDEIWNELIAQL